MELAQKLGVYAVYNISPSINLKLFPYVPLGVGGWPYWATATKSEGVWLIFPAISFQGF